MGDGVAVHRRSSSRSVGGRVPVAGEIPLLSSFPYLLDEAESVWLRCRRCPRRFARPSRAPFRASGFGADRAGDAGSVGRGPSASPSNHGILEPSASGSSTGRRVFRCSRASGFRCSFRGGEVARPLRSASLSPSAIRFEDRARRGVRLGRYICQRITQVS